MEAFCLHPFLQSIHSPDSWRTMLVLHKQQTLEVKESNGLFRLWPFRDWHILGRFQSASEVRGQAHVSPSILQRLNSQCLNGNFKSSMFWWSFCHPRSSAKYNAYADGFCFSICTAHVRTTFCGFTLTTLVLTLEQLNNVSPILFDSTTIWIYM